jgi:long-chain acyl-CoA synthetase
MIASGGPRNTPPGTSPRLFSSRWRTTSRTRLQVKIKGTYTPISSRTVGERVRRIALGLQELGIKAGDRGGDLLENRPEWALAGLRVPHGIAHRRPLYPNLPPEQAAYILNDCGAVAIFLSDAAQAAKIAQVRSRCTTLRHVITFAESRHEGADLTLAEGGAAWRCRGRRTTAGAATGSTRSRCSPTM